MGQDLNKLEKVNFRDLADIPSTTHATYGLYRYPAKFIPHIVAYVLENYGNSETEIFDPFAGYGTAGVVSRVYGYNYEMWDLNPLLETLHKVATLKFKDVNVDELVEEMSNFKQEFVPDWPNREYWYPEEFLSFLYKKWGFYHSLNDEYRKAVLTVPLLKTSRHFSYNDPGRMKLSKSPKSEERIESLRSGDWKSEFYDRLTENLRKVLQSLREYQDLGPKPVECIVKGGVDTFKEKLEKNRDILITSPPYMQSQEYMRHAKMDLFWLGYPVKKIRELKKLEIPYRDIKKRNINSKTFEEFKEEIEEEHMRETYNNYFWGTLGSLTRLSKNINEYLFLFVGRASLRGRPVPIDRIFAEHLTSEGWTYENTLVDQIDSKQMFSYENNPATDIEDMRAEAENLVILRKD